jgi:Flp pilus assembly protein CpaB
LVVVRISVSGGLAPIAASSAVEVIGRRAAVPLVRGALLTMAEIANATSIDPGDAIVGVAVKASQLPAGGVSPGSTVDVVLTGVPGTPDTNGASSNLAATVLASGVLVTSVQFDASSSTVGTMVVSLLAPRPLAGIIASASAAGQVALVLVGGAS